MKKLVNLAVGGMLTVSTDLCTKGRTHNLCVPIITLEEREEGNNSIRMATSEKADFHEGSVSLCTLTEEQKTCMN